MIKPLGTTLFIVIGQRTHKIQEFYFFCKLAVGMEIVSKSLITEIPWIQGLAWMETLSDTWFRGLKIIPWVPSKKKLNPWNVRPAARALHPPGPFLAGYPVIPSTSWRPLWREWKWTVDRSSPHVRRCPCDGPANVHPEATGHQPAFFERWRLPSKRDVLTRGEKGETKISTIFPVQDWVWDFILFFSPVEWVGVRMERMGTSELQLEDIFGQKKPIKNPLVPIGKFPHKP